MDFEVCIDSVEGAIAASVHGAKRVELCAALGEGGLTPSFAMIESVVKNTQSEVYVMIRPSAGGFVYSDHELELMQRDIMAAASLGAHGVVFGALNVLNEVDIQKNLYLMESALQANLGTTFHRAIDLCIDPKNAIEHLINLGFDRVLSSGGKPKAAQGLATLQSMIKTADGKIEIMAGSGINAANVQEFMNIGLNAVHFTAQRVVNEDLTIDMGPKYRTDEKKIREIATQLSHLNN